MDYASSFKMGRSAFVLLQLVFGCNLWIPLLGQNKTTPGQVTLCSDCSLQLGNWCYKTFVDVKSHADAEKWCQNWRRQGHLVWITDSAEWESVAALLDTHPFVDYWFLGLKETPPTYQWTSGHNATYVSWEYYEPNSDDENCVTMERPQAFRWADVMCDREERYVCKAPCPSSGCNTCPFSYHGWCYKASKYKKSQKVAETECRTWKQGGHLVWFQDKTEARMVTSYLTDISDVPYWFIGLEEKFEYQGRLHWTSGANVSYVNWGRGEPTDRSEACVTTERPREYAWADVNCRRLEAFVCKAPCVVTETTTLQRINYSGDIQVARSSSRNTLKNKWPLIIPFILLGILIIAAVIGCFVLRKRQKRQEREKQAVHDVNGFCNLTFNAAASTEQLQL